MQASPSVGVVKVHTGFWAYVPNPLPPPLAREIVATEQVSTQ
jgi:hypothetical protein